MEGSAMSKGGPEQEHKADRKISEKDTLKEERSSETMKIEQSPGSAEKHSRKTKSKRNAEASPSPDKIQDKLKEKEKHKNLSAKRRPVKSSNPYDKKFKTIENTERQKSTATKKPKPKHTQTEKQQSAKRPNQYITRTYPTPGSKTVTPATNKSSKQSTLNLDATNKETATTEVKQFSFPYHKILSGASVAPVKMYPQKILIKRNLEDEEGGFRHWINGLFQTTKLSLKLRLLRLFLVWIFFRVLNKQTSWISDRLGIGVPDEIDPSMKPPKPRPGERYIKVFHESSPHPIHVRVKTDQGLNPNR